MVPETEMMDGSCFQIYPRHQVGLECLDLEALCIACCTQHIVYIARTCIARSFICESSQFGSTSRYGIGRSTQTDSGAAIDEDGLSIHVRSLMGE